MAQLILGRDPTGLPRDINVSATGDLLTSGTAGMLQAGTITMLQAGTVSKLQSGTISMSQAGTVNMLQAGTVSQLQAGTISMVQAGTIFARPEVTWGTVLSGTCTVADTEYAIVLPANCRQFEVQARSGTITRLAFVTGKVAAPTEPYLTLKAGGYFYSPPLLVASGTVYIASATAGTQYECMAWT